MVASVRVVPSVHARVRLKISGIAPWSPVAGIFGIIEAVNRLKISGIAPWSPKTSDACAASTKPPQDFWNRAVVANKNFVTLRKLTLPPQDFWNRAVVAIPLDPRKHGRAPLPPQDFWNRAVVAKITFDDVRTDWLRLKISGIAPWSPCIPPGPSMPS